MVTVMGTGLGFVSDGLHKDGSTSVCSHHTFTAHIFLKLITGVKTSSCLNFETCTFNICGTLGHQTSEHFDNGQLCVCMCVLFIWGPKCNNFSSRLLRKKNTKQKQLLLSIDWMWVYLESYTAASPLSTQVLFWPGVQDQLSSCEDFLFLIVLVFWHYFTMR